MDGGTADYAKKCTVHMELDTLPCPARKRHIMLEYGLLFLL